MNFNNGNSPYGNLRGDASNFGQPWGGISGGNPHNPSQPGQPGQRPSEQPTRPQTHPGNPQTDPQRLSPDPTTPATPKTDPTYPETNPRHIPNPVSEYKKSEQDESFKNSDLGGAIEGGNQAHGFTRHDTSATPMTGKGETEGTSANQTTDREEDIVSLLNELVVINNDRTEGYKRAADETEDENLKSLFMKYSAQSREYHGELVQLVRQLHGEPADGTKNSGKLFRIWMDIKAALTAKDRKAVLSSCEFGEDEALNSYQAVCKNNLPANISAVVTRQKSEIQQAHDHIKSLRDYSS